MCRICDEGEDLFDDRKKYSRKGEFFPGLEVSVDGSLGTMYVFAVPDTYEPGAFDREFKIKYCPECGRKFKEG